MVRWELIGEERCAQVRTVMFREFEKRERRLVAAPVAYLVQAFTASWLRSPETLVNYSHDVVVFPSRFGVLRRKSFVTSSIRGRQGWSCERS